MTTEPMGQLGDMPVIMSPVLKGRLSQLLKYGTPNTGNPFLSKKGYVE